MPSLQLSSLVVQHPWSWLRSGEWVGHAENSFSLPQATPRSLSQYLLGHCQSIPVCSSQLVLGKLYISIHFRIKAAPVFLFFFLLKPFQAFVKLFSSHGSHTGWSSKNVVLSWAGVLDDFWPSLLCPFCFWSVLMDGTLWWILCTCSCEGSSL